MKVSISVESPRKVTTHYCVVYTVSMKITPPFNPSPAELEFVKELSTRTFLLTGDNQEEFREWNESFMLELSKGLRQLRQAKWERDCYHLARCLALEITIPHTCYAYAEAEEHLSEFLLEHILEGILSQLDRTIQVRISRLYYSICLITLLVQDATYLAYLLLA
jgi:hypothetical protein